MIIASKFESHAVCICRINLPGRSHFNSNFRQSLDFKKNALILLFSKMQRCSMDFGRTFPISNFSKRSKQGGFCGLPLKMGSNLCRFTLQYMVKSTAFF